MIWKIQKKSKLNSEKIWTIWKKSKLNSEQIGKIWKKHESNSKKIWKIWRKSKLNSEKIWKIWKKGKWNSEMIRKIWNISVLVIITPKETSCSSLTPPPPHTSLSPIRRGFSPGFVNYKKGALDWQPQVIKFTSCLPMVGGSLRYRLLATLKLVAMIQLRYW